MNFQVLQRLRKIIRGIKNENLKKFSNSKKLREVFNNMKIGVISDTHDNVQNLKKAIDLFNKEETEFVFHCGDWVSPFMPDFCSELKCKIISVLGNNEGDIYRFLQRSKARNWNIELHNKTAELNINEIKMIVYHGDDFKLLNGLIDSQNYDVVFSGHTHKALIEKKGKTLHINPGSISGIRNSNINDIITVAIYDTIKNTAQIIKL